MRTQLSEEDIRNVLQRAEEIHLRTGPESEADIVRAAEEAGLPREAVEQALREQFELFTEPPRVGDLVFAKSSDGRHYVAEVKEETAGGFRVKFVKGGESVLSLESLRPCSFLPGEEVSVDWPWWGWWPVSVVGYNEKKKRVQVTDGWSQEWFSLKKVRLDPPKSAKDKRAAMLWAYSVVGALGGIAGAVVTWLIMR